MKSFNTNGFNKELEKIKIIDKERGKEVEHFIKTILDIYWEMHKEHIKNPSGFVRKLTIFKN